MSKKLVDKIIFHDTVESLHRAIPKECLIKELGGTLGDFETQSSNFFDLVKLAINSTNKWLDKFHWEQLLIYK